MPDEIDAKITTRVIYSLDAAGRVLKIAWEPANYIGARRTCIAQTHELVRRANELLHTLDTWQETWIDDERKLAGYRQALAEVGVLEETEALRAAISDLRPYLAITSMMARGGLPFRAPGSAAMPDVCGQRQRRQG